MDKSKIIPSKKKMERQVSQMTKPSQQTKVIKRVKLKETHKNEDCRMRRLEYTVAATNSGESEKTVMVVGQTGTGKTTLVDAIFNYVKDVAWEDNHRWQLSDVSCEDQNVLSDQTVSQTNWITIYSIPKLSDKVPFRLNLIDTPGFGDSRGVEYDKKLVEHLCAVFNQREGRHGILVLDAVCFVLKASDVRLTTTQQYIFESVLSIFGKDVAENIFLIATHSDTTRPKVYKTWLKGHLPEIPNDMKLRFNNSVLYAGCESVDDSDEDDDDQNELTASQKSYWDMGVKNFQKFFEKLNIISTISTEMTRDVLKERLRLQLLLEDARKQVDSALKKLQCIEAENQELQNHLKEMEKNSDFTIKHSKVEKFEEPNKPGSKALFCTKCKTTCHYPCVRFKFFKYFCQSFTSAGLCEICRKNNHGKYKCNLSDHEFKDTHITEKVTTTEETRHDVFTRHRMAADRKESVIELMDKNTLSYKIIKTEAEKLMDDAHMCYMALNEIWLKENPLYKDDFIEHFISQEMTTKADGYLDRITILKEMQEQAKLAQNAKSEVKILKSVSGMPEMGNYLQHSQKYPTSKAAKK